MLFVSHPKFCISSWGHFSSQEKLKTMLMQYFGLTKKSIMVCSGISGVINLRSFTLFDCFLFSLVRFIKCRPIFLELYSNGLYQICSKTGRQIHPRVLTSSYSGGECQRNVPGPGGGGVLGLIFAGYVPLVSQSPYPLIAYFLANYRPHLRHFWANVIFKIPK